MVLKARLARGGMRWGVALALGAALLVLLYLLLPRYVPTN